MKNKVYLVLYYISFLVTILFIGFSIYKSSKANRYQIKPNLPYVSNLSSQAKNNTNKKYNNYYIEKYNIIPLVLPFIGVKQDEKKNKMIQIDNIYNYTGFDCLYIVKYK